MSDVIVTFLHSFSVFISNNPELANRILAFTWLAVGMTAMKIIKDETSTYSKFISTIFSVRSFASAIVSLAIFMAAYNNIVFLRKMGTSMSAILFGTSAEFLLKLLSQDKVKLKVINAIVKTLNSAVSISDDDVDPNDKKEG